MEDLKQELKKLRMELDEKNEDVEDLKDEVKKQKKINQELLDKNSQTGLAQEGTAISSLREELQNLLKQNEKINRDKIELTNNLQEKELMIEKLEHENKAQLKQSSSGHK